MLVQLSQHVCHLDDIKTTTHQNSCRVLRAAHYRERPNPCLGTHYWYVTEMLRGYFKFPWLPFAFFFSTVLGTVLYSHGGVTYFKDFWPGMFWCLVNVVCQTLYGVTLKWKMDNDENIKDMSKYVSLLSSSPPLPSPRGLHSRNIPLHPPSGTQCRCTTTHCACRTWWWSQCCRASRSSTRRCCRTYRPRGGL